MWTCDTSIELFLESPQERKKVNPFQQMPDLYCVLYMCFTCERVFILAYKALFTEDIQLQFQCLLHAGALLHPHDLLEHLIGTKPSLFFCDALFTCLSINALAHLQLVQNAAARLLTRIARTATNNYLHYRLICHVLS